MAYINVDFTIAEGQSTWGSISPSGLKDYEFHYSVTINEEAFPNVGYSFDHWQISSNGQYPISFQDSNNPTSFDINEYEVQSGRTLWTVVAHFRRGSGPTPPTPTYTGKILRKASGDGKILISSGGIILRDE